VAVVVADRSRAVARTRAAVAAASGRAAAVVVRTRAAVAAVSGRAVAVVVADRSRAVVAAVVRKTSFSKSRFRKEPGASPGSFFCARVTPPSLAAGAPALRKHRAHVRAQRDSVDRLE
jgi:hypothetical protein